MLRSMPQEPAADLLSYATVHIYTRQPCCSNFEQRLYQSPCLAQFGNPGYKGSLYMANFPADVTINCIPNAAFVPCSELLQELVVLVELEQGHIADLQHL